MSSLCTHSRFEPPAVDSIVSSFSSANPKDLIFHSYLLFKMSEALDCAAGSSSSSFPFLLFLAGVSVSITMADEVSSPDLATEELERKRIRHGYKTTD
jgi:hypothetical protein